MKVNKIVDKAETTDTPRSRQRKRDKSTNEKRTKLKTFNLKREVKTLIKVSMHTNCLLEGGIKQ